MLTRERRVLMHSWAAGAILMASLPMARTDLRTKSTSISVAYLLKLVSCLVLVFSETHSASSVRTSLMFFSVANMKMSSSFVTLT